MNLALFDFDGTITASDTWTPFMRLAVSRHRLVAAGVLLSPVIVGYRLGAVSASRGRELAARVGFGARNAAAIRQLGADYASELLPATVRPEALARIDWHRARGDDVVVVSAALDVYLGPWCASRGLDYICTTLEERNGRLTGRYVEGDCCRAEKARRIRRRYDLARYAAVYAYGDSGEDREMLELAQKKYYRWKEIASWSDVTSYGHPPSPDGAVTARRRRT